MLEVEPSSEAVAVHTCCANWSWSDGFQFMHRSDQRQSWAGDGILSLIHLGKLQLVVDKKWLEAQFDSHSD